MCAPFIPASAMIGWKGFSFLRGIATPRGVRDSLDHLCWKDFSFLRGIATFEAFDRKYMYYEGWKGFCFLRGIATYTKSFDAIPPRIKLERLFLLERD